MARRNDLAAKFAKLFNRVEHVERVDGAGVLALGLLRPLRGSAFGLGQPDAFISPSRRLSAKRMP